MASRTVQSSTSHRSVTTDQDPSQSAIASRNGDPITNLPFPTLGGITWIPNVSPEKERQTPSAKTGSIVLAKDLSNVTVKTEEDIMYSDMQECEVLKDPKGPSNATEASPSKLNLDKNDKSQTLTEEQALNLVSGISPQMVYMLPQVNTNTAAATADEFMFSQATSVVDTMGYQSKLKQAVTKAKAKKRGKASYQQPAVSNIINTLNSSVVSSNRTKDIGISEGVQNIVQGSEESETAPLFVAVPLTNLPVGISNVNNSNAVHISPDQYYELLHSGNPEVRARLIHDTYSNTDSLAKEMQRKNIPIDKAGTRAQFYKNVETSTSHTAANDMASRDVLQIPVSEMYTFDHMVRELPNISTHLIPRKLYKDNDLCGTILEAMWSMIEADVFWDAIIYIGKHSIKAHRLVLSSVCNLIHTRVISGDESVLKLRLPGDLDHMAVQAFVKYLYHGVIMITTGNVKDMYRLSNIFEMEALRKFVYDFCTEPALAQIILQCSKDTVNDIHFGEPEIKTDIVEIPNVADEIANTTTELFENIDLEANEITIEFEKVEDKKEEVVFDWTGVDENESNIPIRKRGRSRKGILNSNVASKTTSGIEVPLRVDKAVSIDIPEANKMVENTLRRDEVAPESHEIEKEIGISKVQMNKVDNYSKVSNHTNPASDEKLVKEWEVSSKMNKSLPDPFDSGRFDESKLTEYYIPETPSPVMMTRFRGKNRNVLNAAAKKKAKRNEGIDNANKELKDSKEESGIDEKNKPKKHEKTPPKRSRSSQRKQSTSPLKVLESDTEKTLEKESTAVTNDKDTTIASKFRAPLLVVKKGRAKRSITEPEIPQKSEAIMRPPPKKRTKEISEMMKNVDKDITFTADKLQQDDKIIAKKKKEKGKPGAWSNTSNLSLPKTQLLLQKIAEIDEKGSDIVGERMFRCDFCGNEYLCVKRIVTHVVKTHDIVLDKSAEHVTVLKKNLSPKMCDICGYKAKDPNIYYIHFHKYFRHGVALPHGWSPHKCDLCQKEFFTKFQLKEHKLAHFEETPFICQHCGTGFRTRTGLNSHVFHKHSKVKNHACSECTKTFKTRTQMLVHSRTHSGTKPFACPNCTYRSTTRGNMRLHLTNRHKFPVDVIKNIMENLKATEQEISVDEDGNIIKMKESGFAVKLGTSEGQVLQIDPAGSAETHSMDTLAHVASSKGDGVLRADKRSDAVVEPIMQDQSVMTDTEVSKVHGSHSRNRVYEFTDEKQNASSEAHAIREDEIFNQNMSRPFQLVITSAEAENSVEMRTLHSGAYPIDTYRSLDIGASGQDQILLSDSRIPSTSGAMQEPRMIVRNVLRRFDQRPASDARPFSLLKEALAQSPVPSFDPRDGAAAEIIEVSEAFFQESNMILNSQPEQMGETLQNDYTSNNRPLEYETAKDISAEPLQLVMNNSNLQNKQTRQLSQSYLGIPASPQPYNVKASNKVLVARMPEIPTIIAEEIQQLENMPEPGHPQTSDKNQGCDLTSKTVTQHQSTEEQQLMYDDYYQQNYHPGYHQ